MIHAKLLRVDDNGYDTVSLLCIKDAVFACLERPWRNNENYVSRIPAKFYTAVPHESQSKGSVFWLLEVPGREKVYIHRGNWVENTEGCILLGTRFSRRGNQRMVAESHKAFNRFLKLVGGDNIMLEVKDM